jgi:methylenetetrahydrofolate dehydrogenase (NADP+)/methenyltetrahydrofolate cyclohydrolase
MATKKTAKNIKRSRGIVIDGRALALRLRQSVKQHVELLKRDYKITPGLAVVLVGDDPASVIYVNNKKIAAAKAGIKSIVHHLPKKTTQEELLKLLGKLNRDRKIHGILVQMPLPKHINTGAVLSAIDPMKDVDGLHFDNAGRLASGSTGMVPCTPLGCIALLKTVHKNLSGLHAVVVGRSNLVGKPMAQLLLRENCTVTMAHSKTPQLSHVTRTADILVVAAGSAHLVGRSWVKPGAVVIDVGINRFDGGITGDVDFKAVSRVASHITPVPGGVGPMTIACLLGNAVTAACRQNGLTLPDIKI